MTEDLESGNVPAEDGVEKEAAPVAEKFQPELTEDQKLIAVRATIELHMKEIQKMFQDDCKLTFIMRKPGVKSGTLIVTTDTMNGMFEGVADLYNSHLEKQDRKKLDIQVPKIVV